MKIAPQIPKNKAKKNKAPNYSSWDPLTQAKYLYNLGQQIGPKITMSEAYKIAHLATRGPK